MPGIHDKRWYLAALACGALLAAVLYSAPRATPADQAEHPHMKVISYKPEIKDLQIVDGLAYEWDYFDASFSESGNGNDVQIFRAKALRILKRQPDRSWKFSRVMWNLAEGQSLPK